jgi:hypothetical protein
VVVRAVEDVDQQVLHRRVAGDEVFEGGLDAVRGEAAAQTGQRRGVAVQERGGEGAGELEILDQPTLPRHRRTQVVTAGLRVRRRPQGQQHRVELQIQGEAEQVQVAAGVAAGSVVGVEGGEVEGAGLGKRH